MKATIRDNETLNALTPFELAAYLRGRDWRYIRKFGDNGAVYEHQSETGRAYQALLPLRRDLDDYVKRIGELLELLERVEKRSQLELIRDIGDARADIVRLRFLGSNLDDGSVSLDEAAQMVVQSRELINAAARAAVQPRYVYRARRPEQVTDYLQKVRFGQTERGSFVLTVRSLVPPQLGDTQGSLFTDEATGKEQEVIAADEPFERRVTRILAEALQATINALADATVSQDVSPFQEAVGSGVSANLCEALAHLSSEGSINAVEIKVSWASTRRAPAPTLPVFRFSADAVPILQAAAQILKNKEPYGAFELRG